MTFLRITQQGVAGSLPTIEGKKKKTKADEKMEKVMHLWKQGKLHSGEKKKGKKKGKGPVVPYPEGQEQAVAIGLGYARKRGAKGCYGGK